MSRSKPRWDKRTRQLAREHAALSRECLAANGAEHVSSKPSLVADAVGIGRTYAGSLATVSHLDRASVMAIATVVSHDPVAGVFKARRVDLPPKFQPLQGSLRIEAKDASRPMAYIGPVKRTPKPVKAKRQRFSEPAECPPPVVARPSSFLHTQACQAAIRWNKQAETRYWLETFGVDYHKPSK